MSSKTTPFSLKLFSFVKQLFGLIEEHLISKGPTAMDRQVLKNIYLHKSLPKTPTLVGPKHQFINHQTALKHIIVDVAFTFVLIKILFNDVTVC